MDDNDLQETTIPTNHHLQDSKASGSPSDSVSSSVETLLAVPRLSSKSSPSPSPSTRRRDSEEVGDSSTLTVCLDLAIEQNSAAVAVATTLSTPINPTDIESSETETTDEEPSPFLYFTMSSAPQMHHLPQTLLPHLRQAFTLLSSPTTQTISFSTLQSMLSSLSLPSSPRDLAAFFPPNGPREMNFAHFLTALNDLARFSDERELMTAFAAFEEGDGEVPVELLREVVGRETVEALAEEGFIARRGRESVFKYKEWVSGVKGEKEEK